ncbi:MAG: ABC transporter ATP-binding protein [Thermodesulfobacteriota bacterium]|nr:ABC transporter ATP-binding protein [Thermodesulfobacteriota bacterium]
MSDPIYQIRNLRQRYNGPPVLDIHRLDIDRGMVTGIQGPNGSGKTTFLRLLAFIDIPWKGEIGFNSRGAGPFSEHPRLAVTFLPQTPSLLQRTVYKNVCYGLKIRGIREDIDTRVEKALSMVGLSMAAFGHRRPHALSGGEAQRVALAARMAVKPKVLLLDEPTANVDTESAQRIKQAAHDAKTRWNTTVIVISHDSQWLYEGCDRILQMYQGRAWDTGNRNVVPGPWQPSADGNWETRLADGQGVAASPPPRPDATALVELSFDRPETGRPETVKGIEAMVTRLILEKKTGRIAVSLLAGDLVFTITTSPSQIEQKQLYPGKKRTVFYAPDHVEWLVP